MLHDKCWEYFTYVRRIIYSQRNCPYNLGAGVKCGLPL